MLIKQNNNDYLHYFRVLSLPRNKGFKKSMPSYLASHVVNFVRYKERERERERETETEREIFC